MEEEYKTRMRVELNELTDKMDKLNKYLHSLPCAEEYIKPDIITLQMQVQYQCMVAYREALRSRMEYIGMFEPKDK